MEGLLCLADGGGVVKGHATASADAIGHIVGAVVVTLHCAAAVVRPADDGTGIVGLARYYAVVVAIPHMGVGVVDITQNAAGMAGIGNICQVEATLDGARLTVAHDAAHFGDGCTAVIDAAVKDALGHGAAVHGTHHAAHMGYGEARCGV